MSKQIRIGICRRIQFVRRRGIDTKIGKSIRVTDVKRPRLAGAVVTVIGVDKGDRLRWDRHGSVIVVAHAQPLSPRVVLKASTRAHAELIDETHQHHGARESLWGSMTDRGEWHVEGSSGARTKLQHIGMSRYVNGYPSSERFLEIRDLDSLTYRDLTIY